MLIDASKELQCVQVADEIRIQAIRNKLEKMKDDDSSIWEMWESPSKIEWKSSFLEIIQIIACALFAYLLIFPISTIFMFLYISFKIAMLHINKLKIIWRMKHRKTKPQLPEHKTIWSLWQMQGIDRGEHGEDNCVILLNQWIDILYGEGVSGTLDVEDRRSKMWSRNIKTNMRYYTEPNAPHFCFKNPFECVLEQVSEELPAYDRLLDSMMEVKF